MAQDDPTKTDSSSTQPVPAAETDAVKSAPSRNKPRRRRRWLYILGGIFLVLIVLILLIPTIASTAMVRNIVVGKINNQLKGRVEIADWSISWFNGIHATGVKVFDANGAQVGQVDSLSTQLPLTSAIFGNLKLGDTVAHGVDFNWTQYADGTTTLDRLIKPSPENSQESDLPKISGHLKLEEARATLTRQSGNPKTSHVAKLTGVTGDVTITDINAPIEDHLSAQASVDGGPVRTLTISGNAAAIANRRVNLDSPNVEQVMTLQEMNLAVITPFLPPTAVGDLTGEVNGSLTLKVVNGKSIVISGTITSPELTYLAANAKPDESYSAKQVALTIPGLSIALPKGFSHPDAATLNLTPGAGTLQMTAQLSPALATAVGNFINNPALVNPQSTQGVATIGLTECTNVPMGTAAMSHGPENNGHAVITYSFGGIQLGNQFIAQAASFLHVDPRSFQGAIKDGRATYDRGYFTHDMTLTVSEHQRSIHLTGKTDLADGTMQPFTMTFSPEWYGGQLAKIAPKGLPVLLTGKFNDPHYDFQASTRQLTEQIPGGSAVTNIADQLIGGKSKSTTQPASKPTVDQAIDLIGNALKSKKKDKEKDKK